MERRKVAITPGFLVITCEYAGIPGTSTTPIYELVWGVGEEPIETHKKFVTEIAGKPSAPLNGAVFLDESGKPTTDDSKGIFEKFRSTLGDGTRNTFAGVTAYLELSQMIWRKTFISQLASGSPVSLTNVGFIDTPPGSPPALPDSANWLYTGASYNQRGLVYSVQQEWKASGRLGWNPIIYSA